MTSKNNDKIEALILGTESCIFFQDLQKNDIANHFVTFDECIDASLSDPVLKSKILNYQLTILGGGYCQRMSPIISRRSVGSHFLNFIDLVVLQGDQLWGESVYSSVFKEILLFAIKNQDYKGPVIFLGYSSLALPVMEVLGGFGFEEFVFLTLEDDSKINPKMTAASTGLLNINISVVDSADFIRSQKEYSLCFVMEKHYPQQTLEDMSYFHFLSSQSMVFDLVGDSNFLFKEVMALGVSVTQYSTVSQIWIRLLGERLKDIALKASDLK